MTRLSVNISTEMGIKNHLGSEMAGKSQRILLAWSCANPEKGSPMYLFFQPWCILGITQFSFSGQKGHESELLYFTK